MGYGVQEWRLSIPRWRHSSCNVRSIPVFLPPPSPVSKSEHGLRALPFRGGNGEAGWIKPFPHTEGEDLRTRHIVPQSTGEFMSCRDARIACHV